MDDINKYTDYSHEVKLVKNPFVRYIFIGLSGISLCLAFIGVFLPVLPTTPLVILSAVLYARSSPRFYNWLMNHPTLGPGLRHWRRTGSIPIRVKVISVTMLWLALGSSVVFFVPLFWVKVFLVLVGVGVTFYIVSRPSS